MMVWSFIKKYLGWRNWSVFYFNSIFENLFLLFYIILIRGETSTISIIHILTFLLFSIFSTSYGYLINDFTDIDLDRLHGKTNTFSNDSPLRAAFIVLFFLFLSILSALPFISASAFLSLFIIWIFCTSFYSLRPLRFKERGLAGLLIVIFAQRVLPLLLLFSAFKYSQLTDVLFFLIYILLRGAISDINHQMEDYQNDRATDTQTYAVKFGLSRLEKVFKIILSLERYVLLALLFVFMIRLSEHRWLGFPVFTIPMVTYLFLLLLGLITYSRQKDLDTNPFAEEKNIFQLIHLVFPNIFLPVFFILVLTMINPLFSIFLLLYIFLFRLFDPVILKASIIGRYFFK